MLSSYGLTLMLGGWSGQIAKIMVYVLDIHSRVANQVDINAIEMYVY